MTKERLSGILLHPSALPGKYGIGALGQEALRFVDFLHQAGQNLWQVLPMGHTGYGDSPYQCFSIFAGNPILIDIETLIDEGLVHHDDLPTGFDWLDHKVDYGNVINFKREVLYEAYQVFMYSEPSNSGFQTFVAKNDFWLHDYALFIAIKESLGGKPWWEWPLKLKVKDEQAIETFDAENADEINFHKFVQYQFYRQWDKVKSYANSKDIKIVGDIPLYVAHDSADVWSKPQLFQFDEERNPTKVAGVPPDYFSSTGQLWGNPLYDWDYMKAHGFVWWLQRIKSTTELYDLVRIDHFRGFEAYWAVPYGDENAINGKWVEAPGQELFETVKAQLGDLPIIAEDLGIITPPVEKLRDDFGFPGMKILQFAFHSDEGDGYLPHNYIRNCVVYTGTHDNDTLRGWFDALEQDVQQRVLDYVDGDVNNVIQKMIRLAWSSVAQMAIIPLQDLLDLGSEARMNIPGTPGGNWQWRFTPDKLSHEKIQWLHQITKIYNR